MKARIKLAIGLIIGIISLFWSSQTMSQPGGIGLITFSSVHYAKYRAGTIKRHIASNGAYLPFIWIRSKDAVDFGDIQNWPNTEHVPSVAANERESHEGYIGGPSNFWVPVIFYETVPRSIPTGYQRTKTLGYVAIEPGADRISLYEWEHNRELESYGGFTDHYYSARQDDIVGRYRYRQTGIIGYLLKDGSPGFNALYIGFNQEERNHVLTTDKTNPQHLVNFRYLGYVKSSPGGEYSGELVEYRKEHPESKHCDNFYSTIYEQRLTARRAITRVLRTFWPRYRQVHFLAREVIAGGDDNPLYEGGIALATFSLEHIHGVSPHSLSYAKLLFEFIEESEEQDFAALLGQDSKPTGYLRRTRNYWKSASSWGASTDELVGTFLGLKYFLEATKQDAPEYYTRAHRLLERIAIYLSSRHWIYMDSRIYPNIEAYIDVANGEHDEIFEKSLGTLIFQYPFSRVFKEYLDNSYSGPSTFDEAVDTSTELAAGVTWAPEWLYDFLWAIYGIASCIGEVIDYFFIEEDFVLGCGRDIDTHSEVYELLIQNAYPASRHEGHNAKKFFNHRMLLHTAWLVLDSSEVSSNRKKTFAKRLVRYIYDMWGRSGLQGPARENLLFAVVAKRCFQLLDVDEIKDELDNVGPDWYQRNRVRDFKDEVDRVINKYTHTREIWQPDLPLGEPKRDVRNVVEFMPWDTGWELPYGIGRNHAWRYKDMSFTIWQRISDLTPQNAFNRFGPYYKEEGEWSLKKTLTNLKKYVRVGYKPDDPSYDQLSAHGRGLYFKFEAGGMDFMFMRMLLTHMGAQNPPLLTPDKDILFPTLPWAGASPWTYPAN